MEMMWRLSPRGVSPDYYHHPASQIAGRDDPRLAVVFPIILKIKRRAGKHQSRIGKVDTTVVHGYLSLIGIEGDFHIDYCSYNILMQQAFTVLRSRGFCATYLCRVRTAYHSMAFRLINPK